jgi:uncharacterized protein YeaO (DUF488 family)
MAKHRIRVARIYDDSAQEEGTRVLVDRLWPRGVSKEKARVDVWLKEVAPSSQLRTWYAHDPAKHEEFVRRYRAELGAEDHAEALSELRALLREHPVTLLTATKEPALSQAAALADFLTGS